MGLTTIETIIQWYGLNAALIWPFQISYIRNSAHRFIISGMMLNYCVFQIFWNDVKSGDWTLE